jgi:hypothetical protein
MPRKGRVTPEDRLLRQIAKNYQHSRENLGELQVPCCVSDRFLAFPKTSALQPDGHDLMFVDVMTRDVEGDVRKLCELILDRRALTKALASVRPMKDRT